MKTKYDWSKAPNWARFAARDDLEPSHERGYIPAQWFESKPTALTRAPIWWNHRKNRVAYIPESCVFEKTKNWKDSLEARPTHDESSNTN